jgi:hypothetical protein
MQMLPGGPVSFANFSAELRICPLLEFPCDLELPLRWPVNLRLGQPFGPLRKSKSQPSCACTGEFYGLTTVEAERMADAAAEIVGGRIPLVGGVGRNIKDACALARASRAAGASAIMVTSRSPFVAPRGILDYVDR